MVKEIDVIPDFSKGEIAFQPIPKYTYQKNLKEELRSGFPKDLIIKLLEVMLTIRRFEELIVEMKNGKYSPRKDFKFIGATHLSIGQEAVAVGIMGVLKRTDYITSTHRGHGHSIAKGMFGIYSMNKEELLQFISEPVDSKDDIMEKAVDAHIYRTFAELFGKEDGYCRGRGGGMHIADFYMGHLGANAIVGGSMAIGAGAGVGLMKLNSGRVAICIAGDGAYGNGISHEALNMASMSQFKKGCPVIFAIENNQYGMTGQVTGEVTGIDHLCRRGSAYKLNNMHAELVNGMNVMAVYDSIKRAVEVARSGDGPVLIEYSTYRYLGHSLSDPATSYRSKTEEEAWKSQDCINKLRREVLENNLLSEDGLKALEEKVNERIVKAAEKASYSKDPEPKDIYDGLYTDTFSKEVPKEFSTNTFINKPRRYTRDSEGKILYRHAVAEALAEEMIRDKRVILFGEDVADYGGAFQATIGLLSAFGRERVFNTAISEAAIVGSAAGMAMVGMRPVAEIMYIDFIPLAMDQLGNQVAKTRYMFGGKAKLPLVIRTTIGGGKGYAGQHSQSLEAVVAHFPGLKIAAPSTPYDVKGLLKTAIRDDNPVFFIEHQLLYTDKGYVPEEEYLIPFGEAKIRREGKDITLISYSNLVKNTLKAGEELSAKYGIEGEVIDLRTLIPLDVDVIINSVKKTGHVAIILQAPETGCFGEHIAFKIQENAFSYLKCPVKIIAARDVPPPMAASLEYDNIPSVERIVDSVRKMF